MVDTEKYRHNVRMMKDMCAEHGISLTAVTKVFCAVEPLVRILNEENVHSIGDSRLENLRTMDTPLPRMLLRLPSVHETDEVVQYADYSLNSEMKTIEALNASAERHQKDHGIVLMIDIGDLREGVYYKEDIPSIAERIESLKHVHLKGLGTNVTCYGGVIPSIETLMKFVDLSKAVEHTLGRDLEIFSGGNSSHIPLLEQGVRVEKINNLRIGEAIALGRETAYGERIERLFDDVFTLEADIIELKEKPSIPEGEIGMDAFGNEPSFTDKGIRRRAILAVGKQDVYHEDLVPEDANVELLGSSSDHVIADVHDSQRTYEVGDTMTFRLTYGSLLSLMTSPYVVKEYV